MQLSRIELIDPTTKILIYFFEVKQTIIIISKTYYRKKLKKTPTGHLEGR